MRSSPYVEVALSVQRFISVSGGWAGRRNLADTNQTPQEFLDWYRAGPTAA